MTMYKKQAMSLKMVLMGMLSFLVAFFFSTNYILNYFYTFGGYVFDQGWFAYLSAYSNSFPVLNPQMIGDTFLNTHISLIFYILSFFYNIISWLWHQIPYAFFFSMTQGIWFGLISLAAFLFFISKQDNGKCRNFLAFIFSLLVMINGISLAAIGSIHIEIAIPALFFIFFVFWSNNCKKTSYLCIFFGLIVREDAGFYYSSIFFLMAAYFYFLRDIDNDRKYLKNFLSLAIICFVYSVGAIIFQRLNFKPHLLNSIYLGSPIFHHVTMDFIVKRLQTINHHRLYVYVPFFMVMFLAVIRRDFFLALAPVAILPWVIFSFFAIHNGTGSLSSYHSFPMLIIFLWPAICYKFQQTAGALKRSYKSYFFDASFVIVVSSLLFCLLPQEQQPNIHQNRWSSAGIQWLWHWKSNQEALDAFTNKNLQNKHIVFDDATATLELDKLEPINYFAKVIKRHIAQAGTIDLIVFQLNAPGYDDVQKLIKDANLSQLNRLGTSDYYVASH